METELKGRILAGKILVAPVLPETKTASGLYIPQVAQKKQGEGTVALVGKSTSDEAIEVRTGDVVHYSEYAGIKVDIDQKSYLLMSQSDVLYIS